MTSTRIDIQGKFGIPVKFQHGDTRFSNPRNACINLLQSKQEQTSNLPISPFVQINTYLSRLKAKISLALPHGCIDTEKALTTKRFWAKIPAAGFMKFDGMNTLRKVNGT